MNWPLMVERACWSSTMSFFVVGSNKAHCLKRPVPVLALCAETLRAPSSLFFLKRQL